MSSPNSTGNNSRSGEHRAASNDELQFDDAAPPIRENIIRLAKTAILGGTFVLAIAGGLFISIPRLPQLGAAPILVDILSEIGVGLLAGSAVSGLGYWFVTRPYNAFRGILQSQLERIIANGFTGIRADFASRTDTLISANQRLFAATASLDTMQQCSISKLYASRQDAAADMAIDLNVDNPSFTRLYLLGVSLDDFVNDDGGFNGIWRALKRCVNETAEAARTGGPVKRSSPLDVRILVIHPQSLSGKLRAEAESRDKDAGRSRLYDTVRYTVTELYEFQKKVSKNREDLGARFPISFEVRLYHQVSPTLFLAHTNFVTYAQQYHFWSSRLANVSVPLIRYEPEDSGTEGRSIHSEIDQHFLWIWDNASITAAEWVERGSIGIDRVFHEAGAVNAFNLPEVDNKKRIRHALENATQRIDILGFSLASFFTEKGDFYLTVLNQLESENGWKSRGVQVRVLLLSPECEQAYYRSYRQYLIKQAKEVASRKGFERYKSSELHKDDHLYKDTTTTLDNLSYLMQKHDLDNIHPRVYESAPNCFVLIVDDRVFVEQYHFGKKIRPATRRTLLGKDMPLIEYTAHQQYLSDEDKRNGESSASPYHQIVDHFNFVFDTALVPDISRYAST